MADTVWLEVALNGPFTRARQPRIPVAEEEIVAEGIACAEAGAAIVHVHAYADGRPHEDADLYARIIEGIRSPTGAIVYPTLAFHGTLAERFRPVEALAARGLLEWTVVDPGSVNITLHEQAAAGEHGILYANPDPDLHHGLALAARHGFHPAYAIYEPGFARHGAALAAHYPGLPQPVYRIMLSEGFTFGFPPRAWALDAYAALRAEVAACAPWMIAGLAVDVLPLVSGALARGFHVRVGLEDAPLGSVRTNLDLVAEAARLIRAAGRGLATPAEVRAELRELRRG
jgi:uncharacterized protein (DUF849 family)